jgi:hypothetical protein
MTQEVRSSFALIFERYSQKVPSILEFKYSYPSARLKIFNGACFIQNLFLCKANCYAPKSKFYDEK